MLDTPNSSETQAQPEGDAQAPMAMGPAIEAAKVPDVATQNAIFRIAVEAIVRLPRVSWADKGFLVGLVCRLDFARGVVSDSHEWLAKWFQSSKGAIRKRREALQENGLTIARMSTATPLKAARAVEAKRTPGRYVGMPRTRQGVKAKIIAHLRCEAVVEEDSLAAASERIRRQEDIDAKFKELREKHRNPDDDTVMRMAQVECAKLEAEREERRRLADEDFERMRKQGKVAF